jgi:ABC-type taurine transport system ATPase subunit
VTVVRAPAKPILASASASMASLVIAEPVDPQRRTKVQSISFDIQTGIKTTIMIDGTIEEEPFDSSALTFLAPEPERVSSLTAFVNQLRKMAPEDTTGSIRTSVAEPEDTRLIRHR